MTKEITNIEQAKKQNKRFSIYQTTFLIGLVYLVFNYTLQGFSMFNLYKAGNPTINAADFAKEIQKTPFSFVSQSSLDLLLVVFGAIAITQIIYLCMWFHGAFYTSKHFLNNKNTKTRPLFSVIDMFIPLWSIYKVPSNILTLIKDYTNNKMIKEFIGYWFGTIIIFPLTMVTLLPFNNSLNVLIFLQTTVIIVGFVTNVMMYRVIKVINKGINDELNLETKE
jgi:hypothetical protein